MAIVLHYFPLKARNILPLLVAAAGVQPLPAAYQQRHLAPPGLRVFAHSVKPCDTRVCAHRLLGGIEIETPQTAWPDFKPNTMFGQLPHLRVDGLEISQSMAIARVLSRRAKLEGASEADFAMSEMLLEQFCDIIGSVANAKSSPDQ